ncbi:Cytochrome P450 2U1 [Araneus ventricosus]|uniref:Cytochrome P450 2U1 n=1 Tax=Araneus ventricosus TaxID=182803 RepID=A0A4Y2V7A9_ARAVE|nr:Cytochrome P450 2U1 [Araneus ventricosus]GBO21170.1 Cytochrome P450 2U1 [Araneus ventricosus]GBO21172.1 Cytochrome P450 2U1 [Araneus ventricosus]GBO21177.1 Cytochrome P450 2U1 [Araneus ventricosus]
MRPVKLIQDIIDEHKTTYDEETPRDIIGEYFKERDKRRSRGDPTAEYFTEEATLGGYRIPKGAIVLLDFYSSHHDPKVYEEPEKFNPSRFIEGKRKAESPILFGMGKRSCLGEGFVMMQTFLLLVTLIQNFQLTLPRETKKISYEEFMTGNLLICAKPRTNN